MVDDLGFFRSAAVPRTSRDGAQAATGAHVRRMPVAARSRAVNSCSSAAHAPGRQAWRVSGSVGPGAPLEGGRGRGKAKAIKLQEGYRRPRWWRPPRPRERPNRRRKRRVVKSVRAAMEKGEQMQASPGAEADIVILVLQESLRKAILRAEDAEAIAKPTAQPRGSALVRSTQAGPKQEHREDQQGRKLQRAQQRATRVEAKFDQAKARASEAEAELDRVTAELDRVTAKLSRSRARADEAKARAEEGDDELERVTAKLGRAQEKLAKAKRGSEKKEKKAHAWDGSARHNDQDGRRILDSPHTRYLAAAYAEIDEQRTAQRMAVEADSAYGTLAKVKDFAMFVMFLIFWWYQPFGLVGSLAVVIVYLWLCQDSWREPGDVNVWLYDN